MCDNNHQRLPHRTQLPGRQRHSTRVTLRGWPEAGLCLQCSRNAVTCAWRDGRRTWHPERPRLGSRAASTQPRGRTLALHESRLSGALVLAAVQLESETRPPPPPRRQIHRTEGGWSCSTIWNYVLKGDDSTYLANFRCTRRQFDDLVGQLEAGAPYMVSRLGGRGNPTLFRPRSHGRVLKETEAAKADGW